MFKVIMLDMNKLFRNEDLSIDYSKDFFGREVNFIVIG